MREQTEDVVSDGRLAIFERWLAPEPIVAPGAYAAQVARSVIRQLRRQLPRAEGDAEELLTTDLPTRTPFDELVASGQSPLLPPPHGKVQAAIDDVVCSGKNLECLCSDRKRLAKLRFITNQRAKVIQNLRKARENRRDSESADSQ